MSDPCLSLIGLARRGGNVQIGEDPVGTLCRAGKAKLLLLASDAAENTVHRAAGFARPGGVPVIQLPYSKAELGYALGRASCAMAALSDAGFSIRFLQKLHQTEPERYADVLEISQELERKYSSENETGKLTGRRPRPSGQRSKGRS